MHIPHSVRDVIATGPHAHLITLNTDGSSHHDHASGEKRLTPPREVSVFSTYRVLGAVVLVAEHRGGV